jgi:hypothetical protein
MKLRRYQSVASLIIGLSLVAPHGGIRQSVAAPRQAQPTLFPAGIRASGYELGLLAAACWMGRSWSDTEKASASEGVKRDEVRCRDLVISIYGRVDQPLYDQIRVNDPQSIDDLLAKIRATEPAETRDRTVALFRDVAAAARENLLAHRAADRVKLDYDADAVETKLTADEKAAAAILAQHGALERLLVTPQPGTADRRLLGLLVAVNRMDIARDLPKQLKFYALGHVLTTVFDTPPPPRTVNPTVTPAPGAWLVYLSGVAARAGRPVSDSPALTQSTRETLAWTGVGEGFADRVRSQLPTLPDDAAPELSRIATTVAARLDAERASAERTSKPHAQR